MEDERDLIPPDEDQNEDDLRFAPPVDDTAVDIVDLDNELRRLNDEDVPLEDEQDDAAEMNDEMEDDSSLAIPAEEVDLDAALAAVSTLDDMLAEQEAAEQAVLAQQEAEEAARREAEARLQNPEHFFAMPPIAGMQRGRIDSVVPALILIVSGAWLTFALTTGDVAINPVLVGLVAGGGLALTLIARWLATGRWAVGALFFACVVLFTGGIAAFLVSGGTLVSTWPLIFAGVGLAFIITGIAAGQNRLALPGILIIACSAAALLVTQPILGPESIALLSSLWPVALAALLLLLLLPLVFRNRLRG